MNKDITRRIIQVIVILIIQLSILILAAGDYKWTWLFVFIAISIVILVINYMVLPDDVIKERGRKKANVKTWDKAISGINAFPSFGLYIVSGLDHRFAWTGDLPLYVHLLGLFMLFLGSMLFTWSMVSNSFFSTMVRIQKERNHKVATSGPYRYVRHPGYVGFIVMSISTPLLLGSLYALICSGMTMVLMILRTVLEDKTLSSELDGYKEYKSQVRYKLIPFVW